MSISRRTFTLLLGSINLLLFTIVHGQNPAGRTASISGRVTVSGKPVANAPVNLAEVKIIKGVRIIQSNGQERVDRLGYGTTTNADGIYLFTGLPAGEYQVSALSPAYVAEAKSQTHEGPKQITLDEGEALENVDIALIRGGVITGRVTDDENRPQIARQVRLKVIMESGLKAEVSMRYFYTDDRGLYRIYGIYPGRYIVCAGGKNDMLASGGLGKTFELTHHPNTINAEEAKVIEVKEGSEITGVDIRLVPSAKTYMASGRVIDGENGSAITQIRVICRLIENQDRDYGNDGADALTDLQGNFRLTGLRPGRYKLELAKLMYENIPFATEEKYFEIEGDNVSGVELIAISGGTISGTVVLEEGSDRSLIPKLYKSNVSLEVRRGHPQGDRMIDWKHTRLSPDGSFQFNGLPQGKAWLRFSPIIRSFHLLRIERDGVIQMDGIDVSPSTNLSGVKLVIGHGDGAIRGEVKVVGGSVPEGCAFSASAVKTGSKTFGKSVKADRKGRFLIEGLQTGEYELSITYSCSPEIAPGPTPKLPHFPAQRINVTSGSETNFSITYDYSRNDQ
jgi:Carboxypeptidase regulatory-like domain